MKMSLPKRFLIISISCYAAAFFLLIAVSFFQFAPKEIDTSFRSVWVFNNSMLLFFNNLISIQGLAVLLTFSVFYPTGEYGIKALTLKAFNQTVTIIIVILLCFTALFFTGNEIFKPGIYSRLDLLKIQTETSRTYYEQALKYREDNELVKAREMIERFLAVKPEDTAGEELYDDIIERINIQFAESSDEDTIRPGTIETSELTYDQAVLLARNYLKKDDFYSAYYYASIASGLSNSPKEAKELSAQAWIGLSEEAPDREEKEEYLLFSRKKHGAELLLSGRAIDAYYLYKELSVDYPNDPDVSKYLRESLSAAVKLTYFTDDAATALKFPGINDICFINYSDETEKEIIYIEKMVRTAEGIFYNGIEVLDFKRGSGITGHFTALYGKAVGDHIVLNGIDRENPNIRVYPEYLVTDKMPEMYNTLKLYPAPEQLRGLSADKNIYKKLNLPELLEFEKTVGSYGWNSQQIYFEIFTRILNPCGFLLFSFLMIALGWKYRRAQRKFPLASFILLPITVYITYLAAETYTFTINTIGAFMLLRFGSTFSIALTAVSQVLLLLITFLMISGLNLKDD